MTEKEQALAYLGRDPVLNISMTEPLRLGGPMWLPEQPGVWCWKWTASPW